MLFQLEKYYFDFLICYRRPSFIFVALSRVAAAAAAVGIVFSVIVRDDLRLSQRHLTVDPILLLFETVRARKNGLYLFRLGGGRGPYAARPSFTSLNIAFRFVTSNSSRSRIVLSYMGQMSPPTPSKTRI